MFVSFHLYDLILCFKNVKYFLVTEVKYSYNG